MTSDHVSFADRIGRESRPRGGREGGKQTEVFSVSDVMSSVLKWERNKPELSWLVLKSAVVHLAPYEINRMNLKYGTNFFSYRKKARYKVVERL